MEGGKMMDNSPEAILGKKEEFGTNISSLRRDELDERALLDAEKHPSGSGMDFCSGDGAMALEMGKRLRKITTWDRVRPSLIEQTTETISPVEIIQNDIRDLSIQPINRPFDIVVWQRAIHYLTYRESINVLHRLKIWMNKGARLYVSASGMDSELGERYLAREVSPEERFAFLAEEMQKKHRIMKKVCLYRQGELVDLLVSCGYTVSDSWNSPFGNVKVVAHV